MPSISAQFSLLTLHLEVSWVYTSLEARKQGVSGRVGNLDDGNVEVTLYGSYENVSGMLQWLEKGPETARVDDLDVSDIPYIKTSGFSYF